ncbi:XRE family transcriptional regulator [Amycolatopsis mediterranei S699]|uniref:XRE family transcriptional regulator n=2 Tax=Amycolatopsis mediterranei TaxID=33910 RepID=A0A0H3DEG9_AMYMU|nr:helix-turn-helix transcriptional regulator [Amycolatopsis mediterranei]ADJ48478.1 XRE family transcriptional regulator [Amycolatopsis mediterranei U32]AEK45401.1 XRE family transcriptional regulator [Amycolatopsis mediterranei S699]AFO80189.1 XRE family transcriptional regulator [Amycolatopsis mediterranei S699]AGT87317.1 XRE family transcriptional regulator [Amycolatopsis mediterranei RB]KDO10995.1 XRE family transcriptional regulator [Amycolatopsis mediterranei]
MTIEQVGAELRRLRNAAKQTQAGVARVVGVSRPNLAQWEAGRHLPSVENARLLDDHFGAANALFHLVEAARSPGSAAVGARPASSSLLDVFRLAGRSLAGHLIRDDDGRPVGWRHNLQQHGEHTTLATAYGISAMVVVGEPYIDLHAVVERLYAKQSPYGWQGRSKGKRPEVTAAVVNALFQASTILSAEEGLTHLRNSLDDYSRTRPFLLATALRTSVRLGPDAPLTRRLADDLLAARLDVHGVLLWGEKKEPGLVAPEPTTAHTARAVVALRDLLRIGQDRADVREAVEVGTQWLIERTHPDDGIMEDLVLREPGGQGKVPVNIKHFTSAWVVQALAEAPQVPRARLSRALSSLWERYEAGLGLWAWGSGDLPIWMTLDAVTALRAAALAFAAPPFLPSAVAE